MIRLVEMAESAEVARPLKVLIPLIKEDLANGKQAAEQAGMPYYQAAGQKMLEAKPQVSGGFEDWVERNFRIKPRQAQYYMALAKATSATLGEQKRTAAQFSSLDDFKRRHLNEDRPSSGRVNRPWREGVDKTAEQARQDLKRLKEDTLTRQQERKAERTLALRLIDIGYKVLAKELHPDKGGSKDAMSRLSRVRDRLKNHA
jgi:hypothetical protein